MYFSASLRAMLGMKPDDPALTTGNIIEKIHPADQPAYREAIVRHFKQETSQFVCDFRYIAADESWRWARQHGVAVRHPDGRAYRIVGAMTDVTESKQRDRELDTARTAALTTRRQSDAADATAAPIEERYELAMASINFGVYDWDIESDTIYYAPALQIMLGLGPSSDDQVKRDEWTPRIHPNDLPIYQRALVDHFKGETPRLECEYRYRAVDGSWRWVRQHGIALRGPDGRARRLIGATGDVTEVKQRERELHTARAEVAAAHRRGLPIDGTALQREERYALALESINEGLYDVDLEKDTVYFSPQLRMLLGTSEHLSTVERWVAQIHPDDREMHRRTVMAHYRGETPRIVCEFRFRTRDGNWRWARQHGIGIRDENGRVRRIVGAMGDITELKQGQRELQSAKAEAAAAHRDVESTREMLQTIIDNMTDGVSLFDKDFRWQFSNRHHIEAMQYTPDIARHGMSGYDLLRLHIQRGEYGPVESEDVEARLQEIAARVLTPGGGRYERRMRNGRYIEFNFKPLDDGSVLGVYRDITDLKEREEALAAAKDAAIAARDEAAAARADVERTREALQTVLDNMSDGVMLLAEGGRLRFVNRRLAEFQQYPPELLKPGTTIREIMRHQAERGDFGPGRDPEAIVKERLAIVASPGGNRYERRAASGRYLEFSIKRLDDGGVLIVNRDITELKDREEALAAAKEAAEAARDDVERTRQVMQIVLDNMNDGVMLFDRDFRWQFVNRQAMNFQRFTPDVAYIGVSAFDMLRMQAQRGDFGPVDDIERVVQERAAIMRTPGGIRYARRTAAGRYIEFNFKPLEDGGLLGVYRDITEIKEREEAAEAARDAAERAHTEVAAARADVERTRNLMQTVLDNMNDGVALWDKDFRWQFSNKPDIEARGLTPDIAYPGVSGYDLVRHQTERGAFGPYEDVEQKVEEVVAGILKPGGNRYERSSPDGRHREISIKPLDDGSILGIYRDITELKDREQALAAAKESAEAARDEAEKDRAEAEAANQAKSTFLATMSHEIRTPMNGVLGMIDVLEHQGLDERAAPHGRHHPRLGAGAAAHHRRRARLLQDRGRAAGTRGNHILALRPDRLRRSSTFRPQAHNKGLTLEAEIDAGSDDALVGDPTRLRQILFNLVSNALKFTQRGGVKVHVGTEPLGKGNDARDALGERHRHRARRRAARAPVPAVRAGRFLDHAPVRRHWPRPVDCAPTRPVARRRRVGREHARFRLHFHGHPDHARGARRFPAQGAAAPERSFTLDRPDLACRAAARAGGRRPSGQSRGAGAPARSARRCGRHGRRWRRGARHLGSGTLRRGACRHPHAAHGRPRIDQAHPRGRGRARRSAHADRRRHRQRDERRGGTLPLGRHGRLSGQARERRPAARDLGALAGDPGRRPRRRRRAQARSQGGDRPRHALGLARRRPGGDRTRCSDGSATPRSRPNARSTPLRAPATWRPSRPPRTSSRGPPRPWARPRSAVRLPRSRRPARPATARAVATGSAGLRPSSGAPMRRSAGRPPASS